MLFWITSESGYRPSCGLQGLVVLCLVLGLLQTACGSKRSMEGAKSDSEVLGTIHDDEKPAVRLEGQEDYVAGQSRQAPARSRRHGNTRSGAGRVDSYIVQAGDTLFKIAERKEVYASGWLYPLIYKANREQIPDPNHLTPGLKLRIPRDVPDPEVEIAEEEAMTGQFLDTSPLVKKPSVPSSPPPPAPSAPAPASGGAWGWLLSGLLLAALTVGGFVLWKRRRNAQAPVPPQAPA
jgi:hypothetical protein